MHSHRNCCPIDLSEYMFLYIYIYIYIYWYFKFNTVSCYCRCNNTDMFGVDETSQKITNSLVRRDLYLSNTCFYILERVVFRRVKE